MKLFSLLSIIFLFLFVGCASKNNEIKKSEEIKVSSTKKPKNDKIKIPLKNEQKDIKKDSGALEKKQKKTGEDGAKILKEKKKIIPQEIVVPVKKKKPKVKTKKVKQITCYSMLLSKKGRSISKKYLYDKCYENRKTKYITCKKTNIFIHKQRVKKEQCRCKRGRLCKDKADVEDYIFKNFILKISKDRENSKIYSQNIEVTNY